MNDGISPDQFHAFEGVEDWRVIGDGACAYFRTGSLATGARLVQAISEHRHDARPRQLTVDGWCQDVRERSTLIVVNWRSRGHHTRVGTHHAVHIRPNPHFIALETCAHDGRAVI